jgi:hypothetical protein
MLGERARRVQLLAAMLPSGALGSRRAGCIACAELQVIEEHAHRTSIDPMAQLVRPLRQVMST